MNKIIIIAGPTASGKSRLAVDLALAVGGEVVNADSQQVYRGMDVGTSKPSDGDMRGVPHHLYSIVDPDVDFDAAAYAGRADEAIASIVARKNIPLVCGGTGLYIRALTQGLVEIPPIPEAISEKVGDEIERHGVVAAHVRLSEVDPETAKKVAPSDRQRIGRALQVFESTGVPISAFQKQHGFKAARYECVKFGIRVPRGELHKRINERSRRMFERGLVDEVKGLLARGFFTGLRSFKAIGYRQAVDIIESRLSVEKAIELTARDTRRYARRQETWFRADPEIGWVDAGDKETVDRIAGAIRDS